MANQPTQPSKATPQVFCSQAPAKLILSGEHAVLYTAPALSLSIQLYSRCTSTFSKNAHQPSIAIQLIDFDSKYSMSFAEFEQQFAAIEKRYQAFLQQKLAIQDVLQSPAELFIVALGIFNQKYTLNSGSWSFKVTSDIPTGRGLGSSASVIVSFLHSLFQQHQIEYSNPELLKIAQEIESRQHGKSSGLDPATIIYGGLIQYQNGKVLPIRETAQTTSSVEQLQGWLIDTGKPQSSTGEAVLKVRQQHANNSTLWQSFANCSTNLLNAIKQSDGLQVAQQIIENQNLLTQIGVVPKAIQQFCDAMNLSEHSACLTSKVCGSGSIKGDSAGIIWVNLNKANSCSHSKMQNYLQQLCNQKNYRLLEITADNSGVKNCEVDQL